MVLNSNPYLCKVAIWLGAVALVAAAPDAQAKKPSLVKVRIGSTPPGANVYIDGKDGGIQGQTGGSEPLPLPKGSHRLLLELDGYKPFEQTVNLSKGQSMTFKLEPQPAGLDIKPLATNASGMGGEVFVDGKLAGTVPLKTEVGAGRHTLEIRRPGFLVFTDQVEVKAGETRQVLIALVAEPKATPDKPAPEAKTSATTGSLMVSASSPAEVLVDGVLRGTAPLLAQNLLPGDHAIELRATEGKFEPWKRSVRVTANQQGVVEVKLAPLVEADPGVPVSVIGRNQKEVYVVTLGQAQSCQTPCTLRAQPGRQFITVAGPGSKLFKSEITIPDTPSQVTVQHFTLGKVVGGVFQAVSGLPSLITGSVLGSQALSEDRNLAAFGYISMATTGAGLVVGAIATLGTIKLNRASVVQLGPVPVSALPPPPKLRFLAAGVASTPDRTGAITQASFEF